MELETQPTDSPQCSKGIFSSPTALAGPDIPQMNLNPLCEDCKIPRQGFICNFADGTCLKSHMQQKKK